jgi:hypothetical protein
MVDGSSSRTSPRLASVSAVKSEISTLLIQTILVKIFSFSNLTRLSSRSTSGIKVELFNLLAARMEPEEDPLEAARRQARKRPRESLNCKFTAADLEVQ